jgi:hypothetical protein
VSTTTRAAACVGALFPISCLLTQYLKRELFERPGESRIVD